MAYKTPVDKVCKAVNSTWALRSAAVPRTRRSLQHPGYRKKPRTSFPTPWLEIPKMSGVFGHALESYLSDYFFLQPKWTYNIREATQRNDSWQSFRVVMSLNQYHWLDGWFISLNKLNITKWPLKLPTRLANYSASSLVDGLVYICIPWYTVKLSWKPPSVVFG